MATAGIENREANSIDELAAEADEIFPHRSTSPTRRSIHIVSQEMLSQM